MSATLTREVRGPRSDIEGQRPEVSPIPRAALHERAATAYRLASELMLQKPDWITFFRETLGAGGIVARLFPSPAEQSWFEVTDDMAAIRSMVAELRTADAGPSKEPTKVITVRLPQTLHRSLLDEAHLRNTSMNQLCISKLLLQYVDPTEAPAAGAGL